MRHLIIMSAALLLPYAAAAGPSDRQFPSACIVFTTTEHPDGVGASGLDPSGTLACSRDPDQMTEVSWRFLYATVTGDVYRVTRGIRSKEATQAAQVEAKEVVYSGKRLVIWTDEFHTVTFQPFLPKT